MGVSVATIVTAVVAFLVVMALEGTRGPNRFGPDPKGGADIDTFR